VRLLCMASLWAATVSLGVAQSGKVEFDAVSVKLSPPLDSTPRMRIGPQPGGRWIATNAPVSLLLSTLYPQYFFLNHDFGGPEWVLRTNFDINAVASGNPSREALNEMAREMLRDRFRLQFHVEHRPVDIYAMVIASRNGTLGRGMRPAAFDCTAYFAALQRGEAPPAIPSRPAGGTPACGIATDEDSGTFHLQGGGMTMAQLAAFMESFVMPDRRAIVDRTALDGRYDLDMRFTIYNGPQTDITPTGVPLLKEAMEDALGLRLEPRKESRPGLVIDHIERPSEN
jgi:uncharacterized protein (TIGR03435 family)